MSHRGEGTDPQPMFLGPPGPAEVLQPGWASALGPLGSLSHAGIFLSGAKGSGLGGCPVCSAVSSDWASCPVRGCLIHAVTQALLW